MRVLIVFSDNSAGGIDRYTFIKDQTDALIKIGCVIDFFGVQGKGILGYLKNYKSLRRKIKEFQPQIIHAHYGLCGLLANFQRKIPVVTTYHGSDINNKKNLKFSKIAIFLSKFNIFVSQKNIETAKPKKNFALIPCGVDTEMFKPMDKAECRAKFGFGNNEKLVLFSSSFGNMVKNSALAQEAVNQLDNVKLIELKGYSRHEVAELMNAVDAVLMTSFTEGSPQFTKEAMAVNCPVVSTDVGDVKQTVKDVNNCYITTYEVNDVAEKLKKCLASNEKTNGREILITLSLDNKTIAEKILKIYLHNFSIQNNFINNRFGVRIGNIFY